MKASDYSSLIVELIAKNIVLSRGGALYFSGHDLPEVQFRPDSASEATETAPIKSVYYSAPSFGGKYWKENGRFYVSLPNGFVGILEPRDEKVIWAYVVEHYRFPDSILLDEKELLERLTLRMVNVSFIAEHGDLNEDDFILIEERRRLFAKMHQDSSVPLPGDTVEGTYYHGACKFSRGVIESFRTDGDRLSVCTSPYGEPWAHEKDGQVVVSTSGGPYFGYPRECFRPNGKEKRLFCEFGHAGVCGNGAISFPVEVNKWVLTEGREEE